AGREIQPAVADRGSARRRRELRRSQRLSSARPGSVAKVPGSRRTPGRSRPRPASRPRSTGRARPSARRTAATGPQRGSPAESAAGGSRITGRAVILALVALVLVVSFASSLKAWLQQREDVAETRTEIAETSAHIEDLRQQTRRLSDPAYIERQARQRFGWVMPGEVGYRVIGGDGEPIGQVPELADHPVGTPENSQWYGKLWNSVESAGEPEEPARPK